MIKSICILFILASTTSHVVNGSGINCTSLNPNKRINECIFECIKIIYNQQFCSGCTTGMRATTLQLNVTVPFDSLAQHNYISYDATSGLIKAGTCSRCQNNYTDELNLEKYVKTKELEQIFECSRTLSMKVDSTNEVYLNENCSLSKTDGYYIIVGDRISKEYDWCYGQLGIDEHYEKLKKMINESSEKLTATNTNVEIRSQSADDTSEISIIENGSSIITIDIENEPSADMNSKTATQFEETTTPMSSTVPTSAASTSTTPTSATTSSTTKKPKPTKKKKPKAEEHHYPVSVVIIFSAIGLFLVVMIISAIILSVYVNRRKRFQSRTDSCTYVFDKRED